MWCDYTLMCIELQDQDLDLHTTILLTHIILKHKVHVHAFILLLACKIIYNYACEST